MITLAEALFPKEPRPSRKTFGTWVARTRGNLNTAFRADRLQEIESLLQQYETDEGRALEWLEKFFAVYYYFYAALEGGMNDSNVRFHGMSPTRAALIDAYVYMQKGNPEVWLADLAEQVLLDIHAFGEGVTVPAYRTHIGVLPDLPGDPDRAAKVQLASTIKSMVESVGSSDQATLKSAVRWWRVKYYAEFKEDLQNLLEALVDQLIAQVNGSEDEPFDRIDAMSPLQRMQLSRTMLTVLPTTERGRKHLVEVMNVDASPSGADSLNAKQKRLARSPVHPDQVEKMLKAFRFNSSWHLVPVASADFWEPLQNDPVSIGRLLAQSASVGDTALKLYGAFGAAAASAMQLSQIEHPLLAVAPGARTKIRLMFTRGVDWPELDSAPSGAPAKSVAVLESLFALVGIIEQLYNLAASSSSATEQELFNLVQSVNGVILSGASTVEVFRAVGEDIVRPTFTTRFLLVVTVTLCVVDVCFSLWNVYRADKTEKLVHAATAVAAGLTGLSIFFGALRTTPHPAAFAVGLLGMALTSGAGYWLANIRLQDKADLLRHTYFGADSLFKRRVWTAQVASLKGGGEGFEDLRYAMLDGVREDFARQIAILLGAMGAFGFDWSENFFIGENRVELQTTRKKPGYTKKSWFHNEDLDKTLLPEDSSMDIYDATHERDAPGNNASILSASPADARLPLWLTRGTSGIPGPLTQAAAQVLRQEDSVDKVSLGGLMLPERVEVVLNLETPAWPPTMRERGTDTDTAIPRASVIIRDKL